MAAAPFLLRSLGLAALLLAACTDASQQSSDATPAAAAVQQFPDTPVSSTARADAPAPSPAGPAPAPTGPAQPSDCNAPKAQPFVGRRADEDTRAALTAAVAPVTAIRWVRPGDATTEDYSPQRLNVMLDVGGVIRSIHCG